MAIEVIELHESRHADATEVTTWVGMVPTAATQMNNEERLYRVIGTNDSYAACIALFNDSPTVINSMQRVFWSVVPVLQGDDISDISEWRGVVRYSRTPSSGIEPEQYAPGEKSVRFNFNATQQQVTGALSVGTPIKHPSYSGNASDFGGLINMTSDGPKGTSIQVSELTVDVSYVYDFNPPSLANIEAITDKINSNAFGLTDTKTGYSMTFAAGEAMCEGLGGGAATSDGRFQLTGRLKIKRNETNKVVAGITIPSLKGHEYLQIYSIKKENTTTNRVESIPAWAIVTQLYEEEVFSL